MSLRALLVPAFTLTSVEVVLGDPARLGGWLLVVGYAAFSVTGGEERNTGAGIHL